MAKMNGNTLYPVPESEAGARLDAFLASPRRSEGGSRRVVRDHIESGGVTVNGLLIIEPKRRLRNGDLVGVTPRPNADASLAPNTAVPFLVLYEDDDLLVIDKPAGVQMHPGGKDMNETVANRIAAEWPGMLGVGTDPTRPGIVHRLDRNTSGVVVLAKNDESYEVMRSLFQSRAVEKTYLAVVDGATVPESGAIGYPLAARTGTLRRQAILDQTVFDGKTREARTDYRVVRRYGSAALIEVSPKTGRTHQIRVHLAAIGHPVMGDRLYGGRRMRREGVPERQLLHAFRVAFPFHGNVMSFEAPVPEDFEAYLRGIDGPEEPGYPGEASNRHDGA